MSRLAATVLSIQVISNGGTDMPDHSVAACVFGVAKTFDLPAPRGPEGTALVPVMFSPH